MPLVVVPPLLPTRDQAFTKTGCCGSLAGLFYHGTPHSWLFFMLRLSLAFREDRVGGYFLTQGVAMWLWDNGFQKHESFCHHSAFCHIALLCILEHNTIILQDTPIIILSPPQPGLNVNRKSVLLFHPSCWYWELLKVLWRQTGWGKVAPWAASLQVVFGGTKMGSAVGPPLVLVSWGQMWQQKNSKSSRAAVSAQSSQQMGTHLAAFKYVASLPAFPFYVVQM